LVDVDEVEAKNLTRQNFIESDLGEKKSIALARRYSAAFGIPIRAIAGNLEDVLGLQKQDPDILIGAVDAHKARRVMAEWLSISYNKVWIDSGNETVAGQVVCGYRGPGPYRPGMRAGGPARVDLPTVSQLYPLPVEEERRQSCADLEEIESQMTTVNLTAAMLIVGFVRLLLEDVKRLSNGDRPRGLVYHAVTFNVANGGFSTRFNTPSNLADAGKPLAPSLR
jgi:hypothetical protein